MSTTILIRADRMIIHLRSFDIIILIDTTMRKRFNLRTWLCFVEIMGAAFEPASLDRSAFRVYILYL